MIKFNYGNSENQISYPYTYRNPEIRQAFILTGLGDYSCDTNYYTERDNMAEFLFISTIEGRGWIKYLEYETELIPGSLAVINCRNYQHYKTSGDSWHFQWIHFVSDNVSEIVDFINQNGIFTCLNSAFTIGFEQLKKLTTDISPSVETLISLEIHKIIADMVARRASEINISLECHRDTLNKVISYINENYQNNISIDELSSIANISKFYLIRIFKEMTGITPYRYIVLTRIDKSKNLLRSTNLTISEIAEKCGFSDCNSFINHFKNSTGITPLKFRLSGL